MSELQTNVSVKVLNQASEPLAKITADMKTMNESLQKAGSGSGISSAFKGIGSSATDASKGLGTMQQGLGGFIGSISPVSLGAGAIGAALALLAKSSISAAQELQSVGIMAKVVFGEDFPKMNQELTNLSVSLGRNQSDLAKFASSVTTVATGLGVSKKAAEDMSLGLTELAVSFGKAFNTSDQSVMDAFKSALEGNTRGLRQFNIVLNDNTLQEYLNKQGIDKKVTSLDEASKAIVTYNYLLDETSAIQEAGAQNTGNLADQTKKLSASWNDLQESMGTTFLPAVTAAVQGLDAGLSALRGTVMNTAKALQMVSAALHGTSYDMTFTGTEVTQANIAFQELHGVGLGKARDGMVDVSAKSKLLASDLKYSSSAISGMKGEAQKLEKAMLDLGEGFKTSYTEIGNKSKELEIKHNQAVESIKQKQGDLYTKLNDLRTAANSTASAFAEMGVKFKQSMDDLNTQSITSVGEQLQKIKDIARDIARAQGQEGALSTDQIVGRIANRSDKTSLTLTAEDARGLTSAQEEQVNKTLELQREQKAYTEYLTKALSLNKEIANTIAVGSTDYVKNAEKLIAGDPNLGKGIALSGQTGFAKTQAQIMKQAGQTQDQFDKDTSRNKLDQEKNERDQQQVKEELAALEKKRKAVEYAYQRERAEIDSTKITLDAFHSQYLVQMDSMASVTQKTVDNVKKNLQDLKTALQQAQIDAQYSAQVTSNASSRGASRVGFANGGIVGSRSGGVDVTVGEGRYNEAIVPLPDGRSIPVQFPNGVSSGGGITITIQNMNVSKTADADEVIKYIAREVQKQSTQSY